MMEWQLTNEAFAQQIQAQWPSLARWCARMIGNRDVAEDLAQEAVNAAWRNPRRPARVEEYAPWLRGIARHLCLSWLRREKREMAHRNDLVTAHTLESVNVLESIADPFDVEVGIEQAELARLVERALSLLPMETRRLLIAKYIDDASLAEIAAQLHLTESAAAARLQRGKAAARQVLLSHLATEATEWGFISPDDAGWRATRLWCPDCGAHQLQARLDGAAGTFSLRCPSCTARQGLPLVRWSDQALFRGMVSVRAALTRLSTWGHAYFREGLRAGTAPCMLCGQSQAQVMVEELDEQLGRGIVARCPRCHARALTSLDGLALCHPAAQEFWRKEGRIRTLPLRQVEFQGRSVGVVTFQSVRSARQLDVLTDCATLDVLHLAEGAAGS